MVECCGEDGVRETDAAYLPPPATPDIPSEECVQHIETCIDSNEALLLYMCVQSFIFWVHPPGLTSSAVIFNLPYPLSNIFPTFGNYWFLRLLHKAGIGRLGVDTYRPLTPREKGEAMASSIGPGAIQIDEKDGYSITLKDRLAHNGMLEKFRIYREGLFRGTWTKSIETVVALSELQSNSKRSFSVSGAGLFDDGPRGALKAPATIIYGIDDPAFESRLALDGVNDYLAKDSHTIILEDSGHWLPLETKGSRVIAEVASWALRNDPRSLRTALEDCGLWEFTRAH